MADFEVTPEVVARLRRYFQLGQEELEVLQEVETPAASLREGLIERLYQHVLSFPEMAAVYSGVESIARAKEGQRRYFDSLFQGRLDEEYVRGRLLIGAVHDRMGVEPRWYLAGYAYYLSELIVGLLPFLLTWPQERLAQFARAMAGLMLLDAALVWEQFYRTREARLDRLYTALVRDHNLALKLPEDKDKEIERLAREIERLGKGL